MRSTLLCAVLILGFVAVWAARVPAEPAPAAPPTKSLVLDLGDGATLKMVLVPAGRFTMGSPANETGRGDNEGPQRVVTISRPFYMGIHEVTVAQYRAVMGAEIRVGRDAKNVELPISGVSWNAASEFCRRASELTGRQVALPTEAQWEYACRAGTRTACSFGNDMRLLDQSARFGQRGNAGPLPVGSLKPNPWGLFDMHGNLAEWCADFYAPQYPQKAEVDPTGPATGGNMVVRGGAWAMGGAHVRSASRTAGMPRGMSVDIGFRVVVAVDPPSTQPAGDTPR